MKKARPINFLDAVEKYKSVYFIIPDDGKQHYVRIAENNSLRLQNVWRFTFCTISKNILPHESRIY